MLNKSKGNMYDWITDSWNPLGGECPHSCSYCYVKKFRFPALKEKYSGPPRLYENELKRNLGKGKFWFVGSCIDLFAKDIPSSWIYQTLNHCAKYPQNKYLFQSKNPSRFTDFHNEISFYAIFGTTIETNRIYPQMGDAPNILNRAWAMFQLNSCDIKTMLTIEPIMDFDLVEIVAIIKEARPTWVNIGANTNYKVKLPEPEPGKIKDLIAALGEFTEVKIKPNLNRLLVGEEKSNAR